MSNADIIAKTSPNKPITIAITPKALTPRIASCPTLLMIFRHADITINKTDKAAAEDNTP